MEVEYKFLLKAEADGQKILNDGLLSPFLGPAEQIEMKSVYYDTRDRALERMRGGLRLRSENGAKVVCLKFDFSAKDGLFKREDYECPADTIEDGLALLPGRGAARETCESLLRKGLFPVAEVSFLRTVRIYRNEGFAFEICVDEGYYAKKADRLPFCELEIELKEGSTGALSELVDEIRTRYVLTPEKRSKLFRAREWAERTPAGE